MAVFYPRCHALLSVLFDGFGGDDTPKVFHVLPRQATVRTTGYKEADTWELEFDARALPVSPEQIRSMEARIFMYAADAIDDPFEKYFSLDSEAAIIGLADMSTARWGSEGRSFSVEGQDYTALLLARPWDPTRRVPIGKPLDLLIQDLVDEGLAFKPGAKKGQTTLAVKFVSPDAPPRVDDASMYKTKTKGQHVKAGTNYWDVIYGLCLSNGFVCYVQGQTLQITTPQTLFKDSRAKAHRVAYGRDLAWIEIERKHGKEVTPQIVASVYDPKTRRQVQAIYPEKIPKPAEMGKVVAGIGVKRDERAYVTPPYGVRTEPELRRFAEAYYNDIARGEMCWRFATKFLTDINGKDMIGLRAADPVLIDWDPFNKEEMHALDPGKRAELLVDLGYSRDVAQAISSNWSLVVRHEHPMYCREVTRTWSQDDGLEISVEARNFIAVGRGEGRGPA